MKFIFFKIYKNDKPLAQTKVEISCSISIGSSKENSDLFIEGLNEKHACIALKEGNFLLSAVEGASVIHNGIKISESWLQPGDFIDLGVHRVQFFETTQDMDPITPEPVSAKKNKAENLKQKSSPVFQKSLSSKEVQMVASYNKADVTKLKQIQEFLNSQRGGVGPDIEVILCWETRMIKTLRLSEMNDELWIGANTNFPVTDIKRKLLLKKQKTGFVFSAPAGCKIFKKTAQNVSPLKNTDGVIEEEGVYFFRFGSTGLMLRRTSAKQGLIAGPLLNLNLFEKTGLLISLVTVALLMLFVNAVTLSPEEIESKLMEKRVSQVAIELGKKRIIPKVVKKKKKVIRRSKPVKRKKVVKKKVRKKLKANKSKKRKKSSAKKVAKKKTAKKNKNVSTGKGASGQKTTNRRVKRSKNVGKLKRVAKRTGQSGGRAGSKKAPVKSQGLLSAFGGKGTRSKLDKVYSGSGDLQGVVDHSTGYTGQKRQVISGTLFEGDAKGSSKSKSLRVGAVRSGITSSALKAGSKSAGSGGALVSEGDIDFGGTDDLFVGDDGGIDRNAIRAVILKNKGAIQACYEASLLRGRKLGGRMILGWSIGYGGVVKKVSYLPQSDLKDRDLYRCLSARLKSWIFPSPSTNEVVSVEFSFFFKRK